MGNYSKTIDIETRLKREQGREVKSFKRFLCPFCILRPWRRWCCVLECMRERVSVCVTGNLCPWQVYPVKRTGIAGPLLLLLSEWGEADGGLCWPDKGKEDSAERETGRKRKK